MITIMESNKVKYPLGAVADIEVLTFGEPGLRTFRLDARSGAASCSIWMEKEQLFQLGVYLRDMVGHLSQEQRDKESDLREEAWSGGELTIDFKGNNIPTGTFSFCLKGESNINYSRAPERAKVLEEASKAVTAEAVKIAAVLKAATAEKQ